MDIDDPCRRETEALIEAIWGPRAEASLPPPEPGARARQNQALAAAMRAYLQNYLDDMETMTPRGGGRDHAPSTHEREIHEREARCRSSGPEG